MPLLMWVHHDLAELSVGHLLSGVWIDHPEPRRMGSGGRRQTFSSSPTRVTAWERIMVLPKAMVIVVFGKMSRNRSSVSVSTMRAAEQ